MDEIMMAAFSDELEKIAFQGKGALIGAGLMGSVAAAKGGMKEWDNRIAEDSMPSTSGERAQMRRQRLKRLATGVGVSALAGAAGGHFAQKGFNHVMDSTKKTIHGAIDRASQEGHKVVQRAGEELTNRGKEVAQHGVDYAGNKISAGVKNTFKNPFKNLFNRKPKTPAAAPAANIKK